MDIQLSEGSLEVIMRGGEYENPIMQVLGTKKVQGSGNNDRYRLLVSDGKYSNSFAMLSTQLNDKVITGELSDYSVIQVDKYMTSSIKTANKEKRVMIIVDLTIKKPGSAVGSKIGNPQTLPEENLSMTAPQVKLEPTTQATYTPKPTESLKANLDSSVLNTQMVLPIASLSPYQNKWVIKVRVINKSAIRTWSNAKGEGKLFSMDLCDESGEIRATAFKNECDKFYDMIEVDKVYYISRCQIKTANKQFSALKNDYEMTFNANTVVAECMEDTSSMPSMVYDFIPIADLADKSVNTMIDVIGVCKSASDVQELTAKSTGKLLKKREVTLVDSSGGGVNLTLWGSEAENFDASNTPVVAVKGARVAEFNGSKSLSLMAGSHLRVQPDLPDAHRLRGWYDRAGADAPVRNISARADGSSGGVGGGEWLQFGEAHARGLGAGERGDYYSLLGVLTFTFADNALYKACPQDACNKKLVDHENGTYRCEKCNREYSDFKYRLLLGANVSDPTGDERVTAFNEAAEAMLGSSAADVGRLHEYDKSAYAQLFEDIKFKTFVFKFRAKVENYNDESRLKTSVVAVQPVDYRDANARLVKSIKALAGIEV